MFYGTRTHRTVSSCQYCISSRRMYMSLARRCIIPKNMTACSSSHGSAPSDRRFDPVNFPLQRLFCTRTSTIQNTQTSQAYLAHLIGGHQLHQQTDAVDRMQLPAAAQSSYLHSCTQQLQLFPAILSHVAWSKDGEPHSFHCMTCID